MPGDEHHLQYTPEPPSVSKAFVLWSAFSALVLLAVAIGGLYGIYRSVVPNRILPAPQGFPQPRVDTHESDELHRIVEAQSKRLETWGWADDQHTLLQIPIERAMQLLAKKGKDGYEPLLAPEAALSAPTAAAEQATIGTGTSQHAAPARGNPPSSEAPK